MYGKNRNICELIQMIKFVLKLLVFYTVLTRVLGVPVYPDRCFEGMGREIENERDTMNRTL